MTGIPDAGLSGAPMSEKWDDPLLITLKIKRHQLRYRDDGTLYAVHDNIGSQIHVGGGNDTQVVSIEDTR